MAATGALTYVKARDALVVHLREDAAAHAANSSLGGRVQTLATRLRTV